MERICLRCGTVLPEESNFCPNCGWQVPGQQGPAPVWQEAPPMGPPLKWFKFVIYVQLFLSALANLSDGVQLLTGSIYGESTGVIYANYPALKPVSMVIGVLTLGLVALALVVRQRLAKFRRGAPGLYLMFMVVSVGVSLIYLVAASLVLGQLVMTASIVGALLGNVLLILLSLVYFRKRAHLFVN